MKKPLLGLLAVVGTAWAWSWFAGLTPTSTNFHVWSLRREAILFSGIAAFVLMSVIMLLATRPAWADEALGGMDKVYELHKWAGILAITMSAGHWLFDLSDDLLENFVAKPAKGPRDMFAMFEPLRHLAKDLGEWSVYLLLAMLVLTLWKLVPYRFWRFVHRAMPVLYLALAMHALVLMPASLWTQPVGAVLAIALAAGVYGSVVSLTGRIGAGRRMAGRIDSVAQADEVLAVRCRVDRGWREPSPGQFAFVTFSAGEGAHPFTIASIDAQQRVLGFEIKALGDYTARLGQRLRAGMPVQIEGPYGRFDFRRARPSARQVWVAGGIGVTPFLAWLDSLTGDPASAPRADFHYCVRNRDTDPFVPRIEALCRRLPSIGLHVHSADRDPPLHASALAAAAGDDRVDIWFCGPSGFAEALREGLRTLGLAGARFHQEAFQMR